MSNKTNEISSGTQDELHINIGVPPPPYEASSEPSSKAVYDVKPVYTKTDKSNFNQNQEFSIPKPTYNYNNHHHYDYNNNNSQPQQQIPYQHNASTIVYVEGNNDQSKVPKQRTCLEKYWNPVMDPMAWTSLLYFLFIAPVIALFAHIWCGVMLVCAIISLIFPPLGFFFCVGTAWSFRALGRLELITATMCTRKHKPSHMYPPVFHTSSQLASHTDTGNGMIRYGIHICLDKYTWMCFLYFSFINIAYSAVIWFLVLAFFILAFSPLMIVAMPLMCIICKKLGKSKVKMSEAILI